MNKPKFTPEQLNKLNLDPEFQKRIKDDKELETLFYATENDKALEDMETAMVIGGDIRIGGYLFPPPVTCIFSMLELIDSPFVGKSTKVERMDIDRCLYVLAMREKAVSPIVEIKRIQAILDRMEGKVNTPDMMVQYMKQQENFAKVWAEFDKKSLEFTAGIGIFNEQDAISLIYQYLGVAGGFSMLPDVNNPEPAEKKTVDTTQIG